jgi:hypothetical protein
MGEAIRIFFLLAAVIGAPLLAVMIVPTVAKRLLKWGAPEPGEPPRSEELEALQQRVAELEERVDFAERLLAQQRDTAFPRAKS